MLTESILLPASMVLSSTPCIALCPSKGGAMATAQLPSPELVL